MFFQPLFSGIPGYFFGIIIVAEFSRKHKKIIGKPVDVWNYFFVNKICLAQMSD